MKPDRIRADHLYRYEFAKARAQGPVLDAACGIGYGSHMLALAGHEITGVDIEQDAIDRALRYYGDQPIRWICNDLTTRPWGENTYQTIVSFETLERLANPDAALRHFRESLRLGGTLLASVPNELMLPFAQCNFSGDKYPHLRHYTPDEFTRLLRDNGFHVVSLWSQAGKTSPVVEGTDGQTLVYECAPI